MLQNIRKNLQGTIAKVIVAIIVVPFALFGIESLLGGGGVQYVADVNGERISAVELQQQINQQKRRLLMSLGDNIDPSMLDDQMLSGPALEFMIEKSLLMQAATSLGLTVSDDTLGEFIGTMPVFQVDGRFDPNLYRNLVSEQGYSPAGFQEALREDLVMTQLRAGLAGSAFATEQEIRQLASINQEQRDIRYAILPLEQFRTDADISDEDIQAWYEENQASYMTEETVALDYIELTVDKFRRPVDEQELRNTFELEQDSFQLAEERRVSHILLEQGADETEAELQLRITAAEERLAAGEAFSEVAAQLSDDIGSAGIGGDLGFTAGDAFPEAMEEAIAELPLNEVSSPVQTDAGWHLLLVTEIRAGESRSFADVRQELEARIQDEQASQSLISNVEKLRDLVFNAEDLASPAAELELSVESSEPVTRDQADGLFANPRLLAAAFSEDVLNEGYNSDVIEIEPEHFVVLRVREHTLPEALPLAQVRAGILAELQDEDARREIRQSAAAMLRQLRQGASIEELALAADYDWQVELAATRDNRAVPADLLRRAFELPAPGEGESSFDYVQNKQGDIEIFELVRVLSAQPESLSEMQRTRITQQLTNENGRRADEYFQQELRARAEISRS